jgi:alpha-beta hydrolase superfamily lysophospholipase
MGAALLVRLLARDGNREKISGLVLASPVVALPRRPRGWEDAVFRFLLTFWPRHRVDVRKFTRAKKNAPVRFVTRDEEHRRWFETAAHKLDRFTFRFFRCLLDLVDGCGAAASRLQLPVLVLYAAHDLFIQPAQIEAFFDRLGSAEKERAFFPAAYHLLLHDHDRDLVLARIEAWLGARLDEIHEGNQPGLASGRASR